MNSYREYVLEIRSEQERDQLFDGDTAWREYSRCRRREDADASVRIIREQRPSWDVRLTTIRIEPVVERVENWLSQ